VAGAPKPGRGVPGAENAGVPGAGERILGVGGKLRERPLDVPLLEEAAPEDRRALT
jgi:hypothetical protein